MNAHHVDPDALDSLGHLAGWDYFLEESRSRRGDPPVRTTTPEGPSNLDEVLDPDPTYRERTPSPPPINRPSSVRGPSPMQLSAQGDDSSASSAVDDLLDPNDGTKAREEPEMDDPPPDAYNEAGRPPVGKLFVR
jgi:hypothetical protein